MINLAIAAFFGDMFACSLMQFGLIVQKLAHKHLEAQQERNLVKLENEQPAKKSETSSMDDNNFHAIQIDGASSND